MNKNNKVQICNHLDCKEEGLYRAPISKSNLEKYQWLCLVHIKEFNKSWNYHKEMGAEEIEIELQKDFTWRRPTRPFGSGINFHNFDFDNYYGDSDSSKIDKKSNKFLWSLNKLGVSIKSTMVDIKKSYKKLAKIYHPDTKNDIKNSDDKFRDLVEAYKYLEEFYKK